MENKQPTDNEIIIESTKSQVIESTQDKSSATLQSLKIYLNNRIFWLKIQGFATLVLTLVIGVLIYFDIKSHLTEQLHGLDNSSHPIQYLTYLIFRSSALGVIATTILVFGGKITIASFDQGVRFTKRKLGTMFLEFLYEKHKDNLNGEVSLTQIMDAFETWNKTVESAFSHIKMEKAHGPVEKASETAKPKPRENPQNRKSGKERDYVSEEGFDSI